MELRSGGLFRKDILCIEDGRCLGRADELLLDCRAPAPMAAVQSERHQPGSAQGKALVVRGRPRRFGLLGREPDLLIDWSDVLVIGEDAILIRGQGREVQSSGGLFGAHPLHASLGRTLFHTD